MTPASRYGPQGREQRPRLSWPRSRATACTPTRACCSSRAREPGRDVRHLDLSDNRLGLDVFGQPSAQFACALALAPCRTRLAALNLARNELGSAAAAERASAIPAASGCRDSAFAASSAPPPRARAPRSSTTSTSQLDLADAGLNDAAVAALAHGLRANVALRALDLSGAARSRRRASARSWPRAACTRGCAARARRLPPAAPETARSTPASRDVWRKAGATRYEFADKDDDEDEDDGVAKAMQSARQGLLPPASRRPPTFDEYVQLSLVLAANTELARLMTWPAKYVLPPPRDPRVARGTGVEGDGVVDEGAAADLGGRAARGRGRHRAAAPHQAGGRDGGRGGPRGTACGEGARRRSERARRAAAQAPGRAPALEPALHAGRRSTRGPCSSCGRRRRS